LVTKIGKIKMMKENSLRFCFVFTATRKESLQRWASRVKKANRTVVRRRENLHLSLNSQQPTTNILVCFLHRMVMLRISKDKMSWYVFVKKKPPGAIILVRCNARCGKEFKKSFFEKTQGKKTQIWPFRPFPSKAKTFPRTNNK
jgi:hypothetical protein